MPIFTARSPISAPAAPISRGARQPPPPPRRDRTRETQQSEAGMTPSLKLDRRSFLVGAAALGGLSLGFRVPFGSDAAAAETAPVGSAAAGDTPEINAWVV